LVSLFSSQVSLTQLIKGCRREPEHTQVSGPEEAHEQMTEKVTTRVAEDLW